MHPSHAVTDANNHASIFQTFRRLQLRDFFPQAFG
jgi:hypothetical protein